MEIYIVRHGQTYWNTLHKLQGTSDTELNEDGVRLAKLTGEALSELRFDRVYCSPLKRAYDTACYVMAGHDTPIVKDPRLQEMNFGILEGELVEEHMNDPASQMYNLFHAPHLYQVEGGETFFELKERVAGFLQDEIAPLEGQCERIMLVAHGAVNQSVLAHLKGHSMEDFWSGGVQPNCSVIILRLENGTFTIEAEGKTFY